MNPITDKFLADNPGADANESIWEQGNANPEYLKEPAFAKDFKAIFDYRQSQLTAGDYVKQAFGSAVRSGAGMIADIPEEAAVAASTLPIPSIKWGEDSSSGGLELTTSDKEDPKKSYPWKLGQGIRSIAAAVTPDEVDGLRDSFWATKIPSSIGSGVSFIAGGGIGRAVIGRGVTKLALEMTGKTLGEEAAGKLAAKLAAESGLKDAAAEAFTERTAGKIATEGLSKKQAEMWANDAWQSKIAHGVPIAGMGAASQGVGGYKEAISSGATPDEASAAFWWNTLGGTSAAIPFAPWLDRLNRASNGTFAKAVFDSGKETIQAALQQGAQTVGSNFVAQKYYDKDRDLLKDMGESAAMGGGVGLLFSALTHAISHARGGGGHGVTPPETATGTPTTKTPAANPIDPAAVYRLDADEKAKVTQLAADTVAGVDSDAHHAQVGQIQGGVNDALGTERYSLYQREVRRLTPAAKSPAQSPAKSPDKTDEILNEANAAHQAALAKLAGTQDADAANLDAANAAVQSAPDPLKLAGQTNSTLPPAEPESQKTISETKSVPDGGNLIPEPPHPLEGTVKLEATDDNGIVHEAEFDAAKAWKETHQRKRVYESLLDCLLRKLGK